MFDQLYWVLFSIPSILISSTVHEFAHAWTATKLGDPTPKMANRLTLNPLAHIDPIGALMMVIARFGWSKPVPTNESNFKNPVIGTALTALSGPASNFLLAIFSAGVLRLLKPNLLVDLNSMDYVATIFITFIGVNISLGIFNLVPLPPLDGHKVVRALLPTTLRRYWEKLSDYSLWILILLFMPFSPLSSFLGFALTFVIELLFIIFYGTS